jgi:hypothetical protein
MSVAAHRRIGFLRLRRGDYAAVLWAVSCCWVAVWGNYLLLSLGLAALHLVLFDLFVTPALVTLGGWAFSGRRR